MKIKIILLFSLLAIVYIRLLSLNLLRLPLYLDEGLYIFWAYLFSQDPSYAYISMQDGKTPLFIWLTAYLNPLFNNFLFTGRFISVIASAVTLICWSAVAIKIIGRKSLYFVLIVFLFTPFNILISRLAFVDSLLISLGSLNILTIYLLREAVLKKQIFKSFVFAVLAGIFLAFAFLTKTSAKIFLMGNIFLLIFWTVQSFKQKEIKSAGLLIILGTVITGIYFEMLRYLKFGALRHWEMIANKEAVLVFTPTEIFKKFFIEHNYGIHIKNIPVTMEYFLFYFGPILLFFAAGIIWMFQVRKHFWILFLVLIFSLGIFLSAKVPASRYFAIIIPEVSIISTFGLFWIWRMKVKTIKILSVILLLISGFFSYKMIFTPLNAYYSSDDRANFVDYNLNALGLNESVKYLEPRKDSAAIAVTGIWGVAEGAGVAFKEKGIEIYTTGNIVSVHPKEDLCEDDYKTLSDKCWKIDFGDITKSPKEKYVYFINENIDIETLKKLTNIEVVREFIRPKTNLKVHLIRLNQ